MTDISNEKNNSSLPPIEALLAKFAVDADRRNAELTQQLKQSREDFDRRSVALDKKLEILTEQVTGIANSNGLVA